MKYLSFLTRLKKTRYFILVAVIMLAFTNNASAKWSVLCNTCCSSKPVTKCWAYRVSCDWYGSLIGSGWTDTWTCRDLDLKSYKPGSYSLNRGTGGTASFTIEGNIINIGSDASEAFLMRKLKNVNEAMRSSDKTTQKTIIEEFQKEYNAFMQTDRGVVSDNRLSQISRELNIEVTSVNDMPSFAFMKIDLVNKEGKNTLTATTDTEGKFNFSEIPDGTYEVKVSKRNGKLPKVGMMKINEISHIVCCCPGPPCEEPFTFTFADGGVARSAGGGTLSLRKAHQYVGTVTLVK
ncbi:MAG: carboxypeptidase-like regulatory domain-containing protein [Ignavibacteria bacterium]|nr:carboxypeptidase-like regulatory domain-containing protein [Ignavibacteria bacterium]